ncbi:hypothetical protein GCM10011321_02460 [Youhaiella tibetensis]|uniref:DUF4160 domain-containing protein n=1 Tax=Paradevosia tibetensis TaxID=1447062 RepID=A0A5B9DQW7_9HYPH|nr:DUF4160 domain-containing protein [Youhaiella tibetensis]QEE21543.1 DUF4160 domain-containing protein [Youhaiella tibetensis]GGF14025.1 hypothetical protein GCM10011321_02460 [Youhaiella tibetensis]
MVTIFRAEGLRFIIFLDDHEPAHVHVFGDGQAKIDLLGPELIWADGMKRGDLRRAMRIVENNRDAFLECWNEIHGTE